MNKKRKSGAEVLNDAEAFYQYMIQDNKAEIVEITSLKNKLKK